MTLCSRQTDEAQPARSAARQVMLLSIDSQDGVSLAQIQGPRRQETEEARDDVGHVEEMEVVVVGIVGKGEVLSHVLSHRCQCC